MAWQDDPVNSWHGPTQSDGDGGGGGGGGVEELVVEKGVEWCVGLRETDKARWVYLYGTILIHC